MTAREQAQTIFISMYAQATLIEALLREGALSPEAARPIVGNILVVTGAWVKEFPEGSNLMSSVLPRLISEVGL